MEAQDITICTFRMFEIFYNINVEKWQYGRPHGSMKLLLLGTWTSFLIVFYPEIEAFKYKLLALSLTVGKKNFIIRPICTTHPKTTAAASELAFGSHLPWLGWDAIYHQDNCCSLGNALAYEWMGPELGTRAGGNCWWSTFVLSPNIHQWSGKQELLAFFL